MSADEFERVLAEHGDALRLESDLALYWGITLADLWRPDSERHLRRLLTLIRNLPSKGKPS